ncbi:transglycosylase SLT domain-containing protein [Herbaspirillum sp. DW155]|uniref:transglycosylase SLT domain-containing protein n=1 Tax=Herbaspirillum sp. DW155 TaxID=3095609 RepID=UPI0030880C5F|nr:transglycosylase SLT domain-containing protein [Herbaspirillum sp. DW155]
MRGRLFNFLLCMVLILPGLSPASAWSQTLPVQATRHRAELTRAAHAGWGLDAPVPVFAAQIHQESGWNPQAVSRVGAKGMAQFMPATARWWCASNGIAAGHCLPENPTWAMRALVGYDRWLYERVRGPDEFSRLWAMSRSYNGGLGHWLQEAAIVRPALDRLSIDSACGKAKRHPSFCRENLDYPRRILIQLQPRYQSWGRSVPVPSS